MNATNTDEVGSGGRVVRLPENPGYGTICRSPYGTLWVRTGHDKDYPWSPVHTRTQGASDEYARKQGWEVVWSPDEPAAPEPAHRLVIEDGFVVFECHAPADALCRAVYDCDCEEWFESGVEDGVPWHETETLTECAGESWERKVRHYGRLDPRECNTRDWVEGDSDPIECQARGTDGRVVIPVEVSWTSHGVEWKPAMEVVGQRVEAHHPHVHHHQWRGEDYICDCGDVMARGLWR